MNKETKKQILEIVDRAVKLAEKAEDFNIVDHVLDTLYSSGIELTDEVRELIK